MPYLSIEDAAALLNSKAILYVNFGAGNYADSGFKPASTGDKTYFYFNCLVRLSKKLQETQFTILRVLNIKYTATVAAETHTVIIAGKI